MVQLHFYEPHIFTHQGATWSSEWVKPLRQVPYPSSPESVLKAISLVDREEIRNYLRQYGEERWDGQKIEQQILKAVQWAERHGVKLFCNEFGAYRNYCLLPDRKAWIQDVRTALEKYGIGWAMWEFDGSFGLVYRENNKVMVDRDLASALGLKDD
ncbi:MAG: cellulase family glycosylhydrolase [Candidatus Aminicenantes bacterium]|nr:cellulase family glycosylhydrolase [Candidatus Aminicenantes bacterium]